MAKDGQPQTSLSRGKPHKCPKCLPKDYYGSLMLDGETKKCPNCDTPLIPV